jgi:large subunit ribosomal protein L25
MNSVVMIDLAGKATRTLPKDVQFHPVNDRPLHVDFLRIGEHSQVKVHVPVRFINDEASPGIKRGGVLNVVRHDLELLCDAAAIPDDIVIDLTGYEIGDSIHISAVNLPKGSASAIDDRDFTIATVVAPSVMKHTEEEEAPADAVPTVAEAKAEAEPEAEPEAETGGGDSAAEGEAGE